MSAVVHREQTIDNRQHSTIARVSTAAPGKRNEAIVVARVPQSAAIVPYCPGETRTVELPHAGVLEYRAGTIDRDMFFRQVQCYYYSVVIL